MTKLLGDAEKQATIYITKLAAAQRQLSAAIRLFFSGEDELAVHTVAHAAYRLLSDLKRKRGRDEAADVYLTAVFYSVRSFHRGTLPEYLSQDPTAMKLIRGMANRLPITASSKFENVKLTISSEVARQFWNEMNRVPNFLKHADKDTGTHISSDEVNEFTNRLLMMQAASAYKDLTGGFLSEGRILWVYSCVVDGDKVSFSDSYRRIASKLEELIPDFRMIDRW